jgi:hypothetical protein
MWGGTPQMSFFLANFLIIPKNSLFFAMQIIFEIENRPDVSGY